MSERLANLWRQHMRRGDFESAWRISDCLLRQRDRYSHSYRNEQSAWRGEPLYGERVLVDCCYGLGDTLQFIRYIPRLRRIASRVIVQAQAAITRLLEHVNGIDTLATRYHTISSDRYDVVVNVTELPHVFRTNLQTIPTRNGYIKLVPRSLPPVGGLKIGLVWEGSDWDRRRAVPLQLFSGFDRIDGIVLHILQRSRALLQRPIDFGINSGSDDIYEAARTIAGLDLLITIDSMPAHLAGAIGVPTWLLLHSDCDWRWMEDRTDSPWYPTMRLFRQTYPGDWRPVIARVKTELEQFANARAQTLSRAA
jgi:hypothetical protein